VPASRGTSVGLTPRSSADGSGGGVSAERPWRGPRTCWPRPPHRGPRSRPTARPRCRRAGRRPGRAVRAARRSRRRVRRRGRRRRLLAGGRERGRESRPFPAPGGGRGRRAGGWPPGSGRRWGRSSSKGRSNMSCRTNASRSAGDSVSRTTSSARPTESASSASWSGSTVSSRPATGAPTRSGPWASQGSSRERSMLRQTRATTVVSQPPRFSTSLVSERLSRSQASWTASSASLTEPSMRYATERRGARCSSKRSARNSSASIGHIPPSRRVIGVTHETKSM
jgi:hypothetical protein